MDFFTSYLRFFIYHFGGNTAGFMAEYVATLIHVSLLLHTVMFRIELQRDYPRIPYIQDDVQLFF